MVEDNGIDIPGEQVQMIKDMINGVKPPDGSRGFLYEIVANKRNGIDVDKVRCCSCLCSV